MLSSVFVDRVLWPTKRCSGIARDSFCLTGPSLLSRATRSRQLRTSQCDCLPKACFGTGRGLLYKRLAVTCPFRHVILGASRRRVANNSVVDDVVAVAEGVTRRAQGPGDVAVRCPAIAAVGSSHNRNPSLRLSYGKSSYAALRAQNGIWNTCEKRYIHVSDHIPAKISIWFPAHKGLAYSRHLCITWLCGNYKSVVRR